MFAFGPVSFWSRYDQNEQHKRPNCTDWFSELHVAPLAETSTRDMNNVFVDAAHTTVYCGNTLTRIGTVLRFVVPSTGEPLQIGTVLFSFCR